MPLKPIKREDRNKWTLCYRIPGYEKKFNESFDSYEEARLRASEIELDKMRGTLRPPTCTKEPKQLTLTAFLEIFIQNYGIVKWKPSYYESCVRYVDAYIAPSFLGDLLLKDIHTSDIDRFYQDLLKSPSLKRPGEKDSEKTVGYSVIAKINALLSKTFGQAIAWGHIKENPVSGATVPKNKKVPRPVWTPEQAAMAIDACEDMQLKCCILLAVGCSMRIDEILGLQWRNVFITDSSLNDGTSNLYVEQQLYRIEKDALKSTSSLERGEIKFVFPEWKQASNCSTSLVLQTPKTAESVRSIYIPRTVAQELLKLKEQQNTEKEIAGEAYQNYDMVFSHSNGRPIERTIIDQRFRELTRKQMLPKVVFHSLRHLSTSLKLQLSGGDIKAVQGDTGHSQSKMVTEVYSHTFNENRLRIAQLMDKSFFGTEIKSTSASPIHGATESVDRVISRLNENPELADIILPIVEKMG